MLFQRCLTGTKRIIHEYIAEVTQLLSTLANADWTIAPGREPSQFQLHTSPDRVQQQHTPGLGLRERASGSAVRSAADGAKVAFFTEVCNILSESCSHELKS